MRFYPPKTTTVIREASTPERGEIIFDDTNTNLYLGDGVSVGGIDIYRYNLKYSNSSETLVSKNKVTTVIVDTLSNAVSLTLPFNPPNGTIFNFCDYSSSFATHNLTVLKSSTNTIVNSTQVVLNTNNDTLKIVFYSNNWCKL